MLQTKQSIKQPVCPRIKQRELRFKTGHGSLAFKNTDITKDGGYVVLIRFHLDKSASIVRLQIADGTRESFRPERHIFSFSVSQHITSGSLNLSTSSLLSNHYVLYDHRYIIKSIFIYESSIMQLSAFFLKKNKKKTFPTAQVRPPR